MFKKLMTAMIFIGMTFSVTVYASYNSEEEGVIVKEYSYVDEEENIVLVQEKAYNPLSNGENSKLLAAAPNWNAKTELGKAFKFPVPQAQFHSTGTSTSSSAINKIGVTTRLYYNGGVLNSATDSQNGSTVAAASAWQGTIVIPSTDTYGSSNHVFEHAGYESWYPNTRKDSTGW